MAKTLTGFKDKNGREICFDDLVIWEKDVLLEVPKSTVGAIDISPKGKCIMMLGFPITEKLTKTLRVFEEKDWNKFRGAQQR